jgi:hypothetical protein
MDLIKIIWLDYKEHLVKHQLESLNINNNLLNKLQINKWSKYKLINLENKILFFIKWLLNYKII